MVTGVVTVGILYRTIQLTLFVKLSIVYYVTPSAESDMSSKLRFLYAVVLPEEGHKTFILFSVDFDIH